MKANEAPEKIYIQSFNVSEEDAKFARKLYFDDVWTEEPEPEQENIEYVHKDAFIKKAYNWLKNYAFVDDNKNVNLPTLLHDFLKDSRNF